MLRGVDVSHYQTVNWSILKDNTDFVIIKATEGTGYIDASFITNQQKARNNSIPLGYYHFARPDLGNSPEAEAEFFFNTVKQKGGVLKGEFLCLDYEVNYSDPVGWCKKFLDHLSSLLGGYKPIIYLNLSTTNSHDWKPVVDEDYGLWLAHYDGITDHVESSTPWGNTVAFKQYTSTGITGSIAGNVDLDVFYGDSTSLQVYGYQSPISPPPVVEKPADITDQTVIPQIKDENGNPMQVGAINSKLSDLQRDLKACNDSHVNPNVGNPAIPSDTPIPTPNPVIVISPKPSLWDQILSFLGLK